MRSFFGCLGSWALFGICGLIGQLIGGYIGALAGLVLAYAILEVIKQHNEEQALKNPRPAEPIPRSPSPQPEMEMTLDRVVTTHAGTCADCEFFTLLRYTKHYVSKDGLTGEFETLYGCSVCNPDRKISPVEIPADMHRTRVTMDNAGHCLNCGKDSLWRVTTESPSGNEETMFCSVCEAADHKMFPVTRTDDDLLR